MWSFPVVAGAASLIAVVAPSPAQQTRARVAERPTIVRLLAHDDSTRAALGLSTTSGSSKRDTLGVLITSIVSGSPAEKAGLEEGDRIASINGTSLQLSPADAGDPEMDGLMGRRLQREMEKVKPGDAVHLRVYANGQFKTVDVKAASESDVFGREGWRFFRGMRLESPPSAPMPPMAPMPPRRWDDRAMLERERASDAAERAMRRAEENMRDTERRMRTMRFDLRDRGRAFAGPGSRVSVNRTDDSITATGSGESYVLRVDGMELAPVNAGLGSYFGSGSENGLLVLRADSSTGLRAGDVILEVNGHGVRDGDTAHISLSTRKDNTVELLRKGKRETVKVRG